MAFYVGQKVVCVDASATYYNQITPKKGSIYTISELEVCPIEGLFISVAEIYHEPHPLGLHNCPWRASRFRPLTSNHTDISIFTAMLGPKLKERV